MGDPENESNFDLDPGNLVLYDSRIRPAFKYQNDPNRPMLAIAGGKGGCGKTTTTLGLAAALSRQHDEAPIIVDADRSSPDVHLLAGVSPSSDRDDSLDSQPLQSATLETDDFPGVLVVQAPSGRVPDGRYHTALDRLANETRPSLVDCPPGASREAVVPLRAADSALLVTTLDPASLRDAAKTAAMADRLGVALAGTVLTRVPAWASTAGSEQKLTVHHVDGGGSHLVRPDIVRRVERLLDAPVKGAIPEVNRSGRAVLEHSVVRAAYGRLASAVRR